MKCAYIATTLVALASMGQCAVLQKRDLLQDLQKKALDALKEAESKSPTTNRTCTIANAEIRQDWNVMSAEDRKAYIKAVQCMISAPAKSNEVIAAVKTRFDDFVAQHINQTLTIHRTGNFLSWHRYYLHAYEKVLRQECGYTGTQPYWNWFTYQDDLRNSPMFDGSDTSMGGDGLYVKHNGSVAGGGAVPLPSGQGGGCIGSGPFKNLQINLGPLQPGMDGMTKMPSLFTPNPRCARRDLTTFASTSWLTFTNLHNITLGPASHSIASFQDELQGRPQDGILGLHGAGHYAINGDGGDFYSSPNDPAFYLHHAMLDQVWWIWQALYPDKARDVAGTVTYNNKPPSRNATTEDWIESNYLGVENVRMGDVLDTLGGSPLCYVYV